MQPAPARPVASYDDRDVDSRRTALIHPLRSGDDVSGGAPFLLLVAASGAVGQFNALPVRELGHPALIRLTTKQTCYACAYTRDIYNVLKNYPTL
jgi:hypothetical protein